MTGSKYSDSDPQICRQCGGLCCQGHPGVWIEPERFLATFDLPLTRAQDTLSHILPREIELREIDGVAIAAPRRSSSGCIFLADDGCSLPVNKRPGQCLALVPALETLIDGEIRCQLRPEGSTRAAIRAWQDYWEG
jgi:hypothetical protein